MYQSIYNIDKISNTFADNQAAFGLAFVLDGIAAGRAKIILEDQGQVFAVHCDPAIQPDWVEHCEFFNGAPFLLTFDKKAKQTAIKGTKLAARDFAHAPASSAIDYEAEKQKNQEYFAWRKSLQSPEDKKLAATGQLVGPTPPDVNWDFYRAINPAALQGYNGLLAEWARGREAFPDLLRVVLQMTAQSPNDLDGAEDAWLKICKKRGWDKPKNVKALQLLNPTQGKGINSQKAIWADPNNVSAFWLLEWLKVIGLFQAGITRLVSGTKDRKTYLLMPHYLAWDRHLAVMKDFRKTLVGSASAIKLDVLAALRYTQAVLQYYEQARSETDRIDWFDEPQKPVDLVNGLQMAYYKSLGQSPAVMNIATINLPRWVAARSRNDLAKLSAALGEHLSIIRNLDEKRGDQFNMLNRYRDFLSANDLSPFFEFTTAYSSFIMSQRERRKPVRQFTTTTLEVIFMNQASTSYSDILTDGFKNLAYAIRQSTVTAQYRKSNKEKFQVRYDVRYGLGQQLARKANYPADFLVEMTKFLHEYNAETSQMYETLMTRYKGNIPEGIRRQMRRRVETSDLDELLRLLGKFNNDSKLICNMLVAYGYAREPYEAGTPETPATDEVESEGDEPLSDEGDGEEDQS